MKTVKIKVSTTRTLVAVGCHTRWDVGTKARLVMKILNTDYPEKATTKEKYEGYAKEYNVKYQTIHSWVKDLSHTCTTSQYALDGTLVLSNTVIKGEQNIETTLIGLAKIKKKLSALLDKVESVPYSSLSASAIKRGKTSVQQELADTVIKSDGE